MKQRCELQGILNIIVVIALSMFLVSCGKNDSNNVNLAPSGSKITINPQPGTITVGGITATSACSGVLWDQFMFTITVVDSNGDPMNDISMTINLDYSPNSTTPGTEVMQLYDGDPSTGGGGLPVPVPYNTKTGSNGTKIVFVRFAYDCQYKGYLRVHAGDAYADAPIEIKAGS